MEEEGQKLQVFDALDSAKLQWYHFTAFQIAGFGYFAGAYDLFCISLVTKLLGRIYYHQSGSPRPGTLPPNVSSAIIAVALAGTLAGQLFFGWLSDKFGRKKVYGVPLLVMIIASLGSGLSFSDKPESVMATLCFFRFWLGFGLGGAQPISATIMSEYANKRTRGALIAAVFAFSGIGSMVGGIVALIVSASFNSAFPAPPYAVDPIGSTVSQADYAWRLILMVGAAPAALAYFKRRNLPETARYTGLVAQNAKQAAADMSEVLKVDLEMNDSKSRNQFGLFSKEFLRRHGLHLLGTTSTWFFLGIAIYSQTLFQKSIFISMKWIPNPITMNALEEVYRVTRAQILISLCVLPGLWLTIGFVDKLGRFTIQFMGFFFMTIFMFALSIPYNHWIQRDNRVGFLVIYSLTFLFANFGPNATTFIVAAEIFPARFRSTCHGISAAAGKAGSIVGTFGFLYAAQSRNPAKTDPGYAAGIGVQKSLFILGCASFLGMVCTLLIPETKGKSLEELSKETVEDEEERRKNAEMANRTVPV